MEGMTWEEREKFDKLLAETRHVIQFTDVGWTVAHPIRERLNDDIFSCRIFWENDDPGLRGRFYLNEDGTVGEPYSD